MSAAPPWAHKKRGAKTRKVFLVRSLFGSKISDLFFVFSVFFPPFRVPPLPFSALSKTRKKSAPDARFKHRVRIVDRARFVVRSRKRVEHIRFGSADFSLYFADFFLNIRFLSFKAPVSSAQERRSAHPRHAWWQECRRGDRIHAAKAPKDRPQAPFFAARNFRQGR